MAERTFVQASEVFDWSHTRTENKTPSEVGKWAKANGLDIAVVNACRNGACDIALGSHLAICLSWPVGLHDPPLGLKEYADEMGIYPCLEVTVAERVKEVYFLAKRPALFFEDPVSVLFEAERAYGNVYARLHTRYVYIAGRCPSYRNLTGSPPELPPGALRCVEAKGMRWDGVTGYAGYSGFRELQHNAPCMERCAEVTAGLALLGLDEYVRGWDAYAAWNDRGTVAVRLASCPGGCFACGGEHADTKWLFSFTLEGKCFAKNASSRCQWNDFPTRSSLTGLLRKAKVQAEVRQAKWEEGGHVLSLNERAVRLNCKTGSIAKGEQHGVHYLNNRQNRHFHLTFPEDNCRGVRTGPGEVRCFGVNDNRLRHSMVVREDMDDGNLVFTEHRKFVIDGKEEVVRDPERMRELGDLYGSNMLAAVRATLGLRCPIIVINQTNNYFQQSAPSPQSSSHIASGGGRVYAEAISAKVAREHIHGDLTYDQSTRLFTFAQGRWRGVWNSDQVETIISKIADTGQALDEAERDFLVRNTGRVVRELMLVAKPVHLPVADPLSPDAGAATTSRGRGRPRNVVPPRVFADPAQVVARFLDVILLFHGPDSRDRNYFVQSKHLKDRVWNECPHLQQMVTRYVDAATVTVAQLAHRGYEIHPRVCGITNNGKRVSGFFGLEYR